MLRKIVISLICIALIGISALSNWEIGHATEQSDSEVPSTSSINYHIQYNGEEREFTINDQTTMTLTGWIDESQTTVNGIISTVSEETTSYQEIQLYVSEELQELALSEYESINYQITKSNVFKVEIKEAISPNEPRVNVDEDDDTPDSEVQNEEISHAEEEIKLVDDKQNIEETPTESNLKQNSTEINKNNNEHTDTSLNVTAKERVGITAQSSSSYSVSYSTHVQNVGWQEYVSDGATSGTSGKALRLEAIKITGVPGISYRTHVQDIGWQDFVSDGQLSGTEGKAKRLEAIQIKLTGDPADQFDIYYRVHAEHYGWLGWAKNGESAGTSGLAKRLEAIEIKLVEKGGKAPGTTNYPFIIDPSVSYSTHVQDYGWMSFVEDGVVSGTEGKAKRLEAIKIQLKNKPYPGNIEYSTHVQNYGWLPKVSNGQLSGTTRENKRLEAIKINLTGEMAEHFDIYYRVHAEHNGWLGWAKNGESAGTAGFARRLEAIEIKLVEKGGQAPGSTNNSFVIGSTISYSTHVQDYGWMSFVENGAVSGTQGKAKKVEAIKIQFKNAPFSGNVVYSTHVQDYGWLPNVSNGQISGTTGENKRLEAIKIDLTGEMAEHFDIYYRVHIEHYGWLGWAKNGMKAGTENAGRRLEAIEIKLVEKGKGEPVNEDDAFKNLKFTVYNYYNLTFNSALNMQMKASPPPQTDINPEAYIAAEHVKVYGSITGFGVNLRMAPNLNSPIGAFLNHGAQFIVLDDNVSGDAFQGSTNWLKVNYNGQILFVHSRLARIDYAEVIHNGVRVREQPNTSSHIFDTVNAGTKFSVIDVSDSWHKIKYTSPSWRIPSATELSYYLNPANFVNDEKQMLQFLDLSEPVNVSASVLNQFLKGKGILDGKGQVYVDASREYGVNVVYLVAHSLLETGNGTSKLANGLPHNGKIVYNMYGIGARDDDPNGRGAQEAYKNGWFDVDTAIKGGAKWIKDKYLSVGQNTLYEMRWNPQGMESRGYANHQYATDIGWAYKQINRLYEIMNAVYQTQRYPIYLEIPVYK